MREMAEVEFIGKCLFVESAGKKRERILVIGDLHFGYGEVLEESGIALPTSLLSDVKKELDIIFDKLADEKKKIDKIVLLGDLKHEFGRVSREEWRDVSGFLEYLSDKCKEIVIVKGNHDVIIEPITRKKAVKVVEYLIAGECCFLHGDSDFLEASGKGIKIWVVGHAHPAIVIRESKGVKAEKYKCFLDGKFKGKRVIIVPSFFPFMEGSDVRDFDLGLAWKFNFGDFEVRVVGVGSDLKVLDFGKLKNLK